MTDLIEITRKQFFELIEYGIKDFSGYIMPEVTHLNCSEHITHDGKRWDLPDHQLEALPEMPNMVHLGCFYNRIKRLPPLPKLVTLNCSNNRIEELPEMLNIQWLNCSNNRIEELPEMLNIQWLNCSNNRIKKLPPLPNATYVNCAYQSNYKK